MATLQYIIKRLLLMIPTFFLVMIIIFLLVRLLPGDPAIAIAGDRLRQLLPDIDVCAVFERDPSAIRVEFVSASKRVLELQDVLCSSDMCRDVTGLIERHPTLLLVDDIHAHIERAVEKLASLEPRCDARAVVNEFPELIYRIHSYLASATNQRPYLKQYSDLHTRKVPQRGSWSPDWIKATDF